MWYKLGSSQQNMRLVSPWQTGSQYLNSSQAMTSRKRANLEWGKYHRPKWRAQKGKIELPTRYFHSDSMLIRNNGIVGPQQIMLLFSDLILISPLWFRSPLINALTEADAHTATISHQWNQWNFLFFLDSIPADFLLIAFCSFSIFFCTVWNIKQIDSYHCWTIGKVVSL